MKKKGSSKIVSYLKSLRFEKNLLSSIQAKYLGNFRIAALLIMCILIFGTVGFLNIPRRLSPEIKIPIITITTVLPGAPPEDIEALITNPIEDKIKSIKGIDTYTSTSLENASSIVIQFISNINIDKARSDVQSIVDGISNLPNEAQTPKINVVDFENQPVWEFAATSKTDTASLMIFAELLKNQLEDGILIDRVELKGFEEEEIAIEFDRSKIEQYGINPVMLANSITKSTLSYPAGSLTLQSLSFPLTINSQITTIQDIRNTKLSFSNTTYRLSDIASITRKPKKEHKKVYYSKDNKKVLPAVLFSVYKTSSSDIDDAEFEASSIVDALHKNYNKTISINTITNTAQEIESQFDDLTYEFIASIVLVFILLFIFLGIRQAIIASLTIPLTFFSTFAIIHALGLSLNFLTLFALLIALGLLIDDTIVVVAAMTRYYKTGKFTGFETAILVWRDFIVPLWSTTITTVWAFIPLLLSVGIIGEFIKPIPIVVTSTLLSSTSIAVFITIPLMAIVLEPKIPKRVIYFLKIISIIAVFIFILVLSPKTPSFPLLIFWWILVFYLGYRERKAILKHLLSIRIKKYDIAKQVFKYADLGFINIEKLSKWYMKIIYKILTNKKARVQTVVIIISFVVLGYILFPLNLIKNEFFPKVDQDLVYVSVELPSGTNTDTTNKQAYNFKEFLKRFDYIDSFLIEVGKTSSSFFGGAQNTSTFLVTVVLQDSKNRKYTSSEIADFLRKELRLYTTGIVKVSEQSSGPPAGNDIQIALTGEDFTQLLRYADKLVNFLKVQSGVINPDKSIKPSTSKYVFSPDQDKLLYYGLTIDTIGFWLRSYISDLELDTLREKGKEIPIRFQLSKKITPDDLYSLSIPTKYGYIPLASLGELTIESNPTQITHIDGKRSVTVFAGVSPGFNVTQKNKEFIAYIKSLKLSSGYNWQTGGVNEENTKSVQSILISMLYSAALILITMILEFRSFRQSFIAILIIPISVAGVFYIFSLFGIPLSFPALVGILALFGIVVTHAIVVIEKINDNRKEGLTLVNSIVDAAGNRLEPVLLTSLATIIGLIPITIADPLWRGLGGAIIAGLLFSGILKLFIVPILYLEFFTDKKNK